MTCCKYRRSSWQSVLLFAFVIQVAFCSKGGTSCDKGCNSNCCQPCCNQCCNNGLRCYPGFNGCYDGCYGPNQRIVYRRDPFCRTSCSSCSPLCSPCTTSCSPCTTSCSPCATACSPCGTSCSPCATSCSPCGTSCSTCSTGCSTCSTGCSPCSSTCSTCSPCSYSCGLWPCDNYAYPYYNNFGCNLDCQYPLGYQSCYTGCNNCNNKNQGCCREFCKVVSECCLQRFLEEYNLAEGEYKICPCPPWMTPRYYCVRYIGKCKGKKCKKGKYKKGKKNKKYWKKDGK